MDPIRTVIHEPLLRWKAGLSERRFVKKRSDGESPLRSELFSIDQMRQRGGELAGLHRLTPRRAPELLLTRLQDNKKVLTEIAALLSSGDPANRRIAPAEEWLLDNFYLIEEQIQTAKRHLPGNYSRQLPRLESGPSAMRPRVYDIALEIISHGDGRIDPESLGGFVAAYQQVTVLKLGELWAIPIMLRLALIENLRRAGTWIAADRIDRNLADSWADQMIEISRKDPKSLMLVVADMARSNPPMSASFVAELSHRLQEHNFALALPLNWIKQWLSESDLTIKQMVQSENQQQAADQISISNSIGSLHLLRTIDWREFVEASSVVDQLLRGTPDGIYSRMDFATRDRYRHAVERMAKKSRLSEPDVAREAIQSAQESGSRTSAESRTAHVGFYLIDKGVPELERRVRMRLSIGQALRRTAARFPLALYLGAVGVIAGALAGGLLWAAYAGGASYWVLALIACPALIFTSQTAVEWANCLSMLGVSPRLLPRLDLSKGIPTELRTLVVVPTMLVSAQGIESGVEALEVRFLANQDPNLHFALLTDLQDAPEETLDVDGPLLQLVRTRIDQLNAKYRAGKGDVFFLFHRPRLWNAQEKIWMGHERKRGKLEDLNTFLCGSIRTSFSLIVGQTDVLSNVQYVITLDNDTQLPRGSAQQMVGAMAHPLNRPRYDTARKCVVEGYGILQPRVNASLPAASRSLYAKLYAGESGVDPYTRTVSDVYQDLFSEGSFIGKGIYDLRMFGQVLKDRFPENQVLSHDLLEGCYLRSGLLSDVQLYEEHPSRYDTDVSRRHRWIRGDWQLAGWLRSNVRGGDRRLRPNPMSGLSRWKVFDNLRRSLVPAAMLSLFLAGWTFLPAAAHWTFLLIGILLIPSLFVTLLGFLKKPDDVWMRHHLGTLAVSAARRITQPLFFIVCLPYEAYFSLNAILRTAVRMLITHRRLLEWRLAAAQSDGRSGGLWTSCRSMWAAPLIALAAAIPLVRTGSAAWAVAAPVLLLWLVSPAAVWRISRPLKRREPELSAGQVRFLRKISRKTWAFFETFVGPGDHWLPPDNYQENRSAPVAHRTSPTNIGLSLLSALSACDFGYISIGGVLDRTARTLRTMESMKRYRGHFYNWYDTQTLKPLIPEYISTVDSGNLAADLLTLRQGLLALADQPILGARVFEGLDDTLQVLSETVPDVAADPPEPIALPASFREELGAALNSKPVTLAAARQCLGSLTRHAVEAAQPFLAARDSQAGIWTQALVTQCRAALDELTFFGELPELTGIPTLRELSRQGTDPEAAARAGKRLGVIERLAAQAGELARMEYGFLYDEKRHLLAIGYNVDARQRDPSFYDLLASEARLCSFVAIAQGQVPQENWFALGRLLTTAGGDPILLSWSGSMFEYLMPILVMPTYPNTLLDQTYKAVTRRQVEYGKARGVPWGVSESGYNAVDTASNYQYRAFGVPGLGLKRRLAEDLVIAPYATLLALMVEPEAACVNLQHLAAEGLSGKFGFYEAVDYTPSRRRRGGKGVVLRSYLAHHQGMGLLALAYLLLGPLMQKRFGSDPSFQATLLLLQERIPKAASFHAHTTELPDAPAASADPSSPAAVFKSADTPAPEVQLLSNGNYHVMVTNAGGGYSRWKDLAVTRWREDATCDNSGSFCYVRDAASGEFWSVAYQPTLKRPKNYEVTFSEGRAEFRRRDRDFDTHCEVVVSSEDDIELRRVRITNRSRMRKTIDVTSYAEVVLASWASDALHPAFSDLFVQTEIVGRLRSILCTRRPRSPDEEAVWMFHLMAVHGTDVEKISYETDRMKFIGRGNTLAEPQAMKGPPALSDTQGSVLDPVVAIRGRMTLEPGRSVTVDIVSGVGETREAVLALAEKYHDRRLADRVSDLAWTHGQVVLRQINASESDAHLYRRIANSILYNNASLRAAPAVLIKNRRGQSGLWGYSISGDLPIVLVQIKEQANIELVRQMIQACAYWRLKGLFVDLVIWNEDHGGYQRSLHEQIEALIVSTAEDKRSHRSGGIFVRSSEQISNEDRLLFQSAARAIITDDKGALAAQIDRSDPPTAAVAPFVPVNTASAAFTRAAAGWSSPGHLPSGPLPFGSVSSGQLIFFNGLGGFTPDGREYVTTLAAGKVTPLPWVNVLANPNFGTVISESGSAYTWSQNAHEFRLTPWNNDPVSDACGEAFYLRDEESGRFWSPTPLPSRGREPYVVRHGFGYSIFEHTEDGIHSELCVYVALDAAVKFTVLKIRNRSGRARRISATGYVEWVLGDMRSKSAMHIATEADPDHGAIYARNPYSAEFGDRTAFFDVSEVVRTVTGDRTEFIGRNGTMKDPAAMRASRLSGKSGAALDPCGAIQAPLNLAEGEEREIVFTLGSGSGLEDAKDLANRHRGSAAAREALEAVWRYWNHTLGSIRVETPDPSLNVLTNGWLLYQTLACRIWARSAFYQSGGAFGFRDQLQDVVALIHARPHLAREHLLLCASRQFEEGDVQHWWHPPSGRGVRTRCSDDYLWLPWAACRFVRGTGDTGVLDERVHFLIGRPVHAQEESYYDVPAASEASASLYEHCVRAILKGLNFGEHGLPLMGSGDWNDGMNLVGIHGKGESVWLGFFLYDVLMRFTGIAQSRGDADFAERCQTEAAKLRQNLELHGWDGEWYRRAYFDDGSPMGSAGNAECRIDSISQSWSVLSEAADPERALKAMAALNERLVRKDRGLIQLLDPPFDKSDPNPGYIKGYVPGVRENGGQYTHAATWAAMAFAKLGDRERAWDLMTLMNPVRHGSSPEGISVYKAEPYVAAADVYALAPHTGRGGWTWYTGSAGCMYRLIIESLLGLRLEADMLHIEPCLPADWTSLKIDYRYRETTYRITLIQTLVQAQEGPPQVTVDGVPGEGTAIRLMNDRQDHAVEVRMSASPMEHQALALIIERPHLV